MLDVLIVGIFLGVVGILFFVASRVKYGKMCKKIGTFDRENCEFLEGVVPRAFSFEELKQATDDFSHHVGRGAFGTVYKGILQDFEKPVAVKKLENVRTEGEKEFKNEIRAIGKTHHRNLVKFLGYCLDGTKKLLVYDYMSNGSLADFLFNRGADHQIPTWDERIRIAKDVARGILYLHQETQQLFFIAISLICYRRELFPRRSFKNVYMPSLGMRFPQLVPDEEDDIAFFSFISCLRGVNAALKKNYLKGFGLRLYDVEGTVEEYCFGFSCKEEQRVAEQTTQASFQACASMMILTLEQLLVGLQKLPSERSLFTCLLLNDTAPNDYKPFSGWGMDEEPHAFLKENLGMERPEGTSIVIDNRGHVKVTLKVRTVLDQSSSEDDESTGSSEDDETIGSPRVGFGDATEDN